MLIFRGVIRPYFWGGWEGDIGGVRFFLVLHDISSSNGFVTFPDCSLICLVEKMRSSHKNRSMYVYIVYIYIYLEILT